MPGADLVDVNVGCPIDHFTRKGMGAALGRQPKRIRRIVEAMKRAVAAVMAGRGVLIKPWLFREAIGGYEDITPDDRLAIYRRYVELAREHWGEDEHGLTRVREFVAWHLGFWCRYAPRRADLTWPGVQTREGAAFARSPLESLLARGDEAAIAWLADRLVARDDVDPAEAPAPSAGPRGPADRDESAEG